MKISILDGFTCVRDDLNWSQLEKFGDVRAYDRTPTNLIIERAYDADIVLSNKVPLFAEQLKNLPNLKYVGILATGYNNVDLNLTRERKIVVTNIPEYGTDSVAQAVFAHILNISNATQIHSEAVSRGDWGRSEDICMCLTPQVELSGQTLGIVGYGAIGRKVAKIARAFGMNVVAFSPSRQVGASDDVASFLSLDEVFMRADILSLNCPLNVNTAKIINAENIRKMKKGAWIINTGRGGLVDENALAQALVSGQISAVGLDVLNEEPPRSSSPLIGLRNCFITPHNAWTSKAARARLIGIATDNIAAWISGSPKNVVNFQ